MFANFADWFDDPVEWARQAWRNVADFVETTTDEILDGLGQAAGVVIALVVLYFLLPHLAHLALLLLLWLLGAPVWFVAALLFGQVH